MEQPTNAQLRAQLKHLQDQLADCQRHNETLRQSQAQLRLLAECTEDLISLTSISGERLYISPSHTKLTGYTIDELQNTPFQARVHPADLSLVENARAANHRGETTRIEYRCLRKDGSYIWLDLRAVPILGPDGEVVQILCCARDITEHKQTREELQKSERRFRALVENTFDAITVIDAAGTGQYRSPNSVRLLGLPGDHSGVKVSLDQVHPEDRDEIARQVAAYLQDPNSPAPLVEFRIQHSSGQWRWIEASLHNLMDDPAVNGFVINWRDITDRKAAEAARLASERRYRALVEDAADAVSIIDSRGRLLYESPNAVRLLGGTAEGLGRDGLRNIHPQDLPEAQRILGELIRTPTMRVADVQLRVRRTDGEYRWLEVSACNRLDDPTVGGIVVNWRDITERKQAEMALRTLQQELEGRVEARTAELMRANQRLQLEVGERQRAEEEALRGEAMLRLLMDSIPAYIAYLDSELRFRWANHSIEEYFGKLRSQLIGKPAGEVLSEASFRDAEPRLRRVLAGEYVKYHGDYVAPEGAVRSYEIVLVPHFEDDGVIGAFALIFDSTELRQAEERVRTLQAQLAHVNRLNTMGEMASGLAHELNQPLAAISNYAEGALLRMRQWQLSLPPLVEALERISEQARRAGEVTHRLRAFITRTLPVRTWVELNDVVRESLRLMETELRSSAIDLRLNLAEPSPCTFVDRIQLAQVVINLVSNAMEAMNSLPAEQRQLNIQSSADRRESHLLIKDSGPGLSPQIVTHLFQPFHTTKPHGMGMGLAISRAIIESFGGTIRAESNPGTGTVFTITLPAAGNGLY